MRYTIPVYLTVDTDTAEQANELVRRVGRSIQHLYGTPESTPIRRGPGGPTGIIAHASMDPASDRERSVYTVPV